MSALKDFSSRIGQTSLEDLCRDTGFLRELAESAIVELEKLGDESSLISLAHSAKDSYTRLLRREE